MDRKVPESKYQRAMSQSSSQSFRSSGSLDSDPPLPVMNACLVKQADISQQLQQCASGYMKLPVVPKLLFKGEKGGVYYINQKGKECYLNRKQREQYNDNKLQGVLNVVPLDDDRNVPTSVFNRVSRRLQQI